MYKIKYVSDLDDVPLATIGADKTTPFLGILDGNCHTLRNIHMKNGYLFDNIGIPNDEYPDDAAYGAVVSNMILKSEHNLCVVNKGQKVRLIGLALRAPSTKAAFAEELTGALADNFLVGCINEGDAKDGLVGKATGLAMYGCMQTATGIDGGALCTMEYGTPVRRDNARGPIPFSWASQRYCFLFFSNIFKPAAPFVFSEIPPVSNRLALESLLKEMSYSSILVIVVIYIG